MTRIVMAASAVLLVMVGIPADDGPRRIPIEGVENAFELAPGLYSGGQPEGDAAFDALKALGVKTIITVDGAIPEVDEAKRRGMRYVHLPVGYDGIEPEQAARIVRAMTVLPGPVFVHCHHGKHRGPTAAAICAIAAKGWNADQAIAWMEEAGTAPEYPGLFATARRFNRPSPADLAAIDPAKLPERAEVPGLVEAMVEIDRRWDRLKASAKAGYRATPDHPDVDPPHEARQLAELFRELSRRDEGESSTRGEPLAGSLRRAADNAAAFEAAIRGDGGDPAAIEAAAQRVSESCTACHTAHRNGSGPKTPTR